MSPRWLVGLIFLFLICSMTSSIIEKQDIIASGSTEKTAMDKLFSFTKIETTDILGTASSFVSTMGETLDGIWTVLTANYSFTENNIMGQILQYFLWAISAGILFSLMLVIGQMIRG